MLKQRVVTAVVLLLLFLPAATSSSDWLFAAVTWVFVSLAVWEWGRLQGYSSGRAIGMSLAWAAVSLVCWLCATNSGIVGFYVPSVAMWGWLLVCLVWTFLLAKILNGGSSVWLGVAPAWRIVVGWVVLSAAWVAVVCLHARGPWVLAGALGTVWLSDIGAYFGGRWLGRRKLAPSISPAKSWEGVWVGATCAALVAVGMAAAGFGLYAAVVDRSGWLGVMLLCSGIVGYGVAGDLFESAVKRGAGVKDSSGLLPGHGGVLDRLDALLPSMPFAMFLLTVSEMP